MTFANFLRLLIEGRDPFHDDMHGIQLVVQKPLGAIHPFIQKALRAINTYTVVVHPIYEQDFCIEAQMIRSLYDDQQRIEYISAECDGTLKRIPGGIKEYCAVHAKYHRILCVVAAEDSISSDNTWCTIPVGDDCSAELYRFLVALVHGTVPARPSMLYGEALKRVRKLSLAEALSLTRYEGLLGKNTELFIASWLDQIVCQPPSLFTLAQYLFACDIQKFYGTWEKLYIRYSPEFWVSFWADQLWQAIVFKTIAQRETVAAATKGTKGLPFSFIRQDYTRHAIPQLQNALEELYALDIRMKQGGITILFESIFAPLLDRSR